MPDPPKHNRPWQLKFHLHHHDHEKSSAPSSHPAEHPVVLSHHNNVIHPVKPPAKRLDFTQDIPMDIPYPPFINVEGVPNFRDTGGYNCLPPTKSTTAASHPQYSVRQGYAFRCSELSQITPKGDETMTETLKIRILFDLRSEAEAANPAGQPKGVKCISTPVYRQKDLGYTLGVQQLKWSTAPDHPKNAGFSQGYVEWYRQIAVYGAHYAYPIIFQHIRDKPDEPFVFHCTAGKDRTGVLTALILKLCGVDNHTVAWEYALTVPGMGVWEEAVEQEMVGDSMMPLRSHGGMTREEAHSICGSRASNMERWLTVVLEKEFGGAAKYLKDHCNFTTEDVEKIKKNLIVAAEGPIKPIKLPGMDEHPQT